MVAVLTFHSPSAADPAIGPGEVHLWRAGLDYPAATIRRLEKLLTAGEIERVAAFRFPSDRAHFIAGRGQLRILLGRYVRLPPQAVRLKAGKFGKPELEGSHLSGITFSVTHAQTLALFAFAMDRRVGVDVELIRPMDEAEGILRRYFTTKEQEAYAQAPPGERDCLFLELWTRREAYLKGIGKGLAGMEGPEHMNLPVPGCESISFRVDPGHIATLAGEGEIKKVTAWKMPSGWAQAAGQGRENTPAAASRS